MCPDLFALGIFGKQFYVYVQIGLELFLLFNAVHIAEMTGTYHHTQLLVEMGTQELFGTARKSDTEESGNFKNTPT
jgi:hypothetical protein